MKHTEGPWEAKRLPSDRLLRWVVIADGPGIGKPIVCERVRTADNAHLIAAAPELLEALKELARMVDGTLQGYGILEPSITTARAAIAKAEAVS
jgi:hypothetical protein